MAVKRSIVQDIVDAAERDRMLLESAIFAHHSLVCMDGMTAGSAGESWRVDLSLEIGQLRKIMELLGVEPDTVLAAPEIDD